MKLTILGSGGAIPKPDRKSPGYLVQTEDLNLVLDFGCDTASQLWKCGFFQQENDFFELDYILVSHSHSDHMGGLIPWLMGRFVVGFSHSNSSPITVIGPEGFGEAISQMMKHMFPEYLDLSKDEKFVELIEMADGDRIKLKNGSLEVRAREVVHVDYFKALAYRIEEEHKTLAYSGDSGICPGIKDIVKDADVAIMEGCQSIGTKEPNNHLSPEKAANIAQQSGVKKLILTHVYDVNTEQEIRQAVKKKYERELVIAEDLMEIEI